MFSMSSIYHDLPEVRFTFYSLFVVCIVVSLALVPFAGFIEDKQVHEVSTAHEISVHKIT